MSQTTIDIQAIAQSELDNYIEQQAFELAPEFEVDGVKDEDFGTLYRLWKGTQLLGTFYQDLNSKWVAQPFNSDFRPRLNTSEQAQLVIIAAFTA
ncbi:hypothetical protein ACE1AT_11125 [Pelatocladus sp. BLCC-F211]|uniref:hypothetical protein n=1 Tax=Pelatocladus sp. BLCC-F211 TaxID=3342752 RepID=UPI0035B85B0B